MLLEQHYPTAEVLKIATDSVYDMIVEMVAVHQLSRLNDQTDEDLLTLKQVKQKMEMTQADILQVKGMLQALQ